MTTTRKTSSPATPATDTITRVLHSLACIASAQGHATIIGNARFKYSSDWLTNGVHYLADHPEVCIRECPTED